MRAAPRIAIVIVAAVVAAHCARPRTVRAPQALPTATTLPREIRVSVTGRTVRVAFEDYVLGASLSEVSPVGESAATVDRVFEVQSVLARTYALAHLGRHASEGFDLCDSTHCQLYQPARLTTSRFAPAARQAVTRTAGRVLTFAGRPAEAVFHSDCGGHTAASATAWGNAPVPYLASHKDDVPEGTHHEWQFRTTTAALRAALNADPKAVVGSRLDAVTVVERDSSGRAVRVEVRGERRQILRAEQVRAILNSRLGDRAIQSTRFTVTTTGSAWLFTGTGFGHGVGLCQVGAAARARRGDSLSDILSAYYPGARLALVR